LSIGNEISKDVSDILNDAVNQKELYVYTLKNVTGTNTITATYTNLTYFTDLKAILPLQNANTGSVTLNINGLGAKTLKKIDGNGDKQNLESGDFPSNAIILLQYDGTDFVLIGVSKADLTELENSITSKTLTAGNGLTGGGDISDNRTFTLGTPSTITGATTNEVTSDSHTHALTVTKADVGLGNVTNHAQAQASLTLTAGNGLTGGGDLTDNRTFTLGTPGDITGISTNSVTETSHTHAFVEDSDHRLVTDAEKSSWNAKWDYDETEIGTYLPTGVIVMWSGAITSIPVGWSLCDGTSGTPNLVDRFILGTATEIEIGDTGGSNSVTLTTQQIPSHTHTATTNTTGAHTHTVEALADGNRIIDSSAGGFVSTAKVTATTSSSGNHSHTVTVDNTGGGEAHENRPAFYKLAFIIKV
jgi:microcystin-dependent protein